MRTIDILPGTDIEHAAQILCAHAPARFNFNGIEVKARYATTRPADLVIAWRRKMDARAVQWSPERTARERRDAEEVKAAQAATDALLAALPSLDWSDHAAPIGWLCAFSVSADRVGVRFDAASVMSIFTANGYAVNVYCGEAFDPASRDIYARWLVGQGLSGIADGYAPHGMVREWADGWRAAFPAQVSS